MEKKKSKEIGVNEIIGNPELRWRDCNISRTSNEGCSSLAPSGFTVNEVIARHYGVSNEFVAGCSSTMEENTDHRRSLHQLENDPILFSRNQNMNFCNISTQNNGPLEVIPSNTLVSSNTILTQTMEASRNIMVSNISIGSTFTSCTQTLKGPTNIMQSDIPSSSLNTVYFGQSFTTIQSYLSGETYRNLMNQQNLVRKELELSYYGLNLREWLESKCFNASKNDRLHLFRKIVEIVDIEHGKGMALIDLRPSSFVILKNGDVKYVGSLMKIGLTRKRGLESQFSGHDNFSEKVQKVGAKGKTVNHYTLDGIDMKNSCTSTGNNWLTSDNAQLEKKWYAFPMEFQIKDLLSQNIYSLGVLLFEFLCHFDSIQARSVAMHDLQYRILPPCFLSENPMEAGFCFWLLHPESSHRPTTREILEFELIPEFDSANVSNDEMEEIDAESDVLLHFLVSLKQHMQTRATSVMQSLNILDVDLKMIENTQRFRDMRCADSPRTNGLNEKLLGNMNELENIYFSMRCNSQLSEMPSIDRPDIDVLTQRERLSCVQDPPSLPTTKENTTASRVGNFFDGICKFACYNKFEVCGTLKSCNILNSENVICCLCFDRDQQYIAAAGVSKKIKIFEFDSLLDHYVDVHYPILEMSGKSKFSSITWNNYIRNYLASTDYDGLVQMWDASIGQGVAEYNEHQKRTWSVDFSRVDPKNFASGGDDCAVKLWNINQRNSVCTICNPANICCVQFSPYSSHLVAFGSADYKINCYDLRHIKIPWCTLTGHNNAVSYVRFLDSETIVSASIDSTLKLWDLKKTSLDAPSANACNLTYKGHDNKKNFVGLAVVDGYIACGSETNEVYAYYKSLPMPIASHKFESDELLSGDENKDNDHFVSSVCWRGNSQVLVAANSNGVIEVLRMT